MRKKLLKQIISFCLLISILFVFLKNNAVKGSDLDLNHGSDLCQTKGFSEGKLKNKWYSNLDYPITMEDDNWKDYSLNDLIDILNIPEDILDKLSTAKLAELLFKYPYLSLITFYEYEELDLFFAFLKNSNIFNELMQRSDGRICILNEYSKTVLDIDRCNADAYIFWRNQNDINAEIFGWQFIIQYYEDFNDEEFGLVKNIVSQKWETYKDLTNNDLMLYLAFDGIKPCRYHEEKSKEQINKIQKSLRTPDGFTALAPPYSRSIEGVSIMFTPGLYHKYSVYSDCLKIVAGYDYDPTKVALLDSINPYSWTVIESSTPKYNCHSFAWIMENNNEYWLDSPLAYMNSSNVTYVGHNVTPQVGDIIVLYDTDTGAINHSAKKIATPSGKSGVYARSKIGGKYLCDAPLSELQGYYHSNNNYDVYRTTY